MYNRTFWLDHVTDSSGRVIQQGTNLSQDNFNKIELGVFEAGVEHDINAIMNRLNARDTAHAEPVLITGIALTAGSATELIPIPATKTRNTIDYVVQAMVTSGAPGNIVISSRQVNGFKATADGSGTVTFIVMGGIL